MKIQYLLSFISIFTTILTSRRTSITNEEHIMLVNVHNQKRSIVQPTASNMQKMRFSQDLANSAQDWADRCVFDHGNPNTGRKYTEFGQNLAADTSDTFLKNAVESWDIEKTNYDYWSGHCRMGMCGHYTQDVWADSYLLGCGARYCQGIVGGYDGNYLVCHYYKQGNYIGQKPYISGTPCSECPSHAPKCVSNLCVSETDSGEDDYGKGDSPSNGGHGQGEEYPERGGNGQGGSEDYPERRGDGKGGSEDYPERGGNGQGGSEDYPERGGHGQGGSEDYPERGGDGHGSEDYSERGGGGHDRFGASEAYATLYWILPVVILIAVLAIVLLQKDKKMKKTKKSKKSTKRTH